MDQNTSLVSTNHNGVSEHKCLFDMHLRRISNNLQYVNNYYLPKFEQPVDPVKVIINETKPDNQNKFHVDFSSRIKIKIDELEAIRKTHVQEILSHKVDAWEEKRKSITSNIPESKNQELRRLMVERLTIEKDFTKELVYMNSDDYKLRKQEEQNKSEQSTRSKKFASLFYTGSSLMNSMQKYKNDMIPQLLSTYTILEGEMQQLSFLIQTCNAFDLLTMNKVLKIIKIFYEEFMKCVSLAESNTLLTIDDNNEDYLPTSVEYLTDMSNIDEEVINTLRNNNVNINYESPRIMTTDLGSYILTTNENNELSTIKLDSNVNNDLSTFGFNTNGNNDLPIFAFNTNENNDFSTFKFNTNENNDFSTFGFNTNENNELSTFKFNTNENNDFSTFKFNTNENNELSTFKFNTNENNELSTFKFNTNENNELSTFKFNTNENNELSTFKFNTNENNELSTFKFNTNENNELSTFKFNTNENNELSTFKFNTNENNELSTFKFNTNENNELSTFKFNTNENNELSTFKFNTNEHIAHADISNVSLRPEGRGQNGINSNTAVSVDDQYRDLLENHFAVQKYLENYESAYIAFIQDDTLKPLKNELTKAINTPVNCISSSSAWHMSDKFDKLDALLKCKTVKTGNSSVSAKSHHSALAFCKDTLAKKIINIGEQVVSVKTETAYDVASIVTELWQAYPDFGLLLYARFKRKCPCLIPYSPAKPDGATDEDYYRSLGYNYADGVVEKQDKYVKRMTGLIRLFAAIVATETKSGSALGVGQAWMIVAATLNLDPQFDVTAVLIHEMLLITGYHLRKAYGKQFMKMLRYIDGVYMAKIDAATPTGCGGPVQRLKTFVSTAIKVGYIEKAIGILPPDFW